MRNLFLAALLLLPSLAVHAQQPCESLASLKLQRATVTSAVAFPEGPVPEAASPNTPPPTVPARCEIGRAHV